ncbi:MAG: alkaline phosphatase [Gemmatimonadetes bacterium]|nr:alkaline phosphatase [Gemmatimonadota bacterium]
MRFRSKTFAIFVAVVTTSCASIPRDVVSPEDYPSRVIVMLADGAGLAQWTAALHAGAPLAVQSMPVVGLIDTPSATHRVTDSGAGATAYATGRRTFNRAVGVGSACQEILLRDTAAVRADPSGCDPLESVLDVARARGRAVGIVTTAAVIDASPAAFVAKSPSRYWYDQIADQYVAAELDVLLGGGRGYFEGGSRYDGRNVMNALCQGAHCITNAEELERYSPDDRRLVGLFAGGAMAVVAERQPSLPLMVRAALERLDRNPAGFFGMFESEGTDDAGHSNVSLAEMASEMINFDRAVGVALDYARRTPGTLLVVLSDHESGGMSILERGDSVFAAYTTGGHTGTMVPLFAFGPGAERFAGIKRNDEVGRILMDLVAGGTATGPH